jgi:hypothetical protein
VPRTRVSEVLLQAAGDAGLEDGFVHVRELGDFSVLYRVAGLLKDVRNLISARSELRGCMLDALHGAGIEIVSPTFMNTRAMERGAPVIPPPQVSIVTPEGVAAEDVAFEKAEEAATIEQMRDSLHEVEDALVGAGSDGPSGRTALKQRKVAIEAKMQAAQEHQQQEKARCP